MSDLLQVANAIPIPWKSKGRRVYQVGPNSRARWCTEDGVELSETELRSLSKAPLPSPAKPPETVNV